MSSRKPQLPTRRHLMPDSSKTFETTKGYFKISLAQLKEDVGYPFPLYIYLARSERFILRHNVGETLTETLLKKHENDGLSTFWCPKEFNSAWLNYLHGETSAKNPAGHTSLESDFTTRLIPSLMDDDKVSETEKVNILTQISQTLLSDLISIADDSPEVAKRAYENCGHFGAQITQVALQTPSIRILYDSTLLLVRSHGQHSSLNSFLSVAFALSSGFGDRGSITDLAIGSLIQDIGLLKLKPSLVATPERRRTIMEKEAYQQHVAIGLDLLEKRGIPITEGIRAIVAQHHEHFDGSGYPNRLSGLAIHPLAQIVAFANQMCDFVSGAYDGTKKTPTEAIISLSHIQRSDRIIQRFDPKLFEKWMGALDFARSKRAHQATWQSGHAGKIA
jgi:HD-GYP domain-containing protein (c-di-GMP phosphodiesterase class II)